MSSRGFSEHKVLLCLDRDLYRAFIKLQADRELGRSYAGLLPYVEGLYRMGYLSKEVYETHFKRYSEPLVRKEEKPEEKQDKTQLEQKDKVFKGMIAQFELHSTSSDWLLRVNREAEKFKDRLESARTLLGLIDNATVQDNEASKG